MKKAILFFIFSATGIIVCRAGQHPETIAPQTGFIENKGQIMDQNNIPNRDVLFLYNSPLT